MRSFTRRGILASAGAVAFASPAVLGAARPRLAVVGGGIAGATFARNVAQYGGIEVLLINPDPAYVTCVHSNLFISGLTSLLALTFQYDALTTRFGITHIPMRAEALDLEQRAVLLSDGTALSYDFLAVAPGIDLDYAGIPGWGREAETVMPHAWKGRDQLEILRARLDAIPDGGVVVILPPPDPARSSSAPYERASLMAQAFLASGRQNCRIIIVDCKEHFTRMDLFLQGWERHYPGMIEWLSPSIHGGVRHVDPSTMSVATGIETWRDCTLVNVIPKQTAGEIALRAGLADADGFCPIQPDSMISVRDPNVMILGDAANAGEMPKSAFSANSQAGIAAAFARAVLLAGERKPRPIYASTCWNLIGAGNAVKASGRYAPVEGGIGQVEGFVSALDESAETRKANADDNEQWFDRFSAGIYG